MRFATVVPGQALRLRARVARWAGGAGGLSTRPVALLASLLWAVPSAAQTLRIADVAVREGNGGTVQAAFDVVLGPPSGSTVTVGYATQDGTATTADSDYTASAGTLSFAPGSTRQTVAVTVRGDTTFEKHETFYVELSGATGGASIDDGHGVGAIVNDDRPAARPAPEGTFVGTASMQQPASGHSAVLLADGRVLVAGGAGTAAQVFDPVTATWTVTEPMAVGRGDHALAPLPDGRALVCGGGSAEIFDPSAGTWSSTPPMRESRSLATATLLHDGRVLVAGGFLGWSGAHLSAEVYDPAAGTWSATGSMAAARGSHTAVLLVDGRVLVAGGSTSEWSGQQGSAEIYDPRTGTWTAAGTLTSARSRHTATLLLDGRVLVTGGYAGGTTYLASAEVFDPATGAWTATGTMSEIRQGHWAALLPDGRVLVSGGWGLHDGMGLILSAAEVYDPATGTWAATGPMVAAREDATATVIPNGRVLVAGGVAGYAPLRSAELYDPGNGGATWASAGAMATTGRWSATATLLTNGSVLVAGGHDGRYGNALASAELRTSSGTWVATPPMAVARGQHTATLLADGRVLVAGGETDGWGTPLTSAEIYDPVTGFWSTTGSLGTARAAHTATLLPDGRVLAAGGGSVPWGGNSAEVYDPGPGTWTPVASMLWARGDHQAVLLMDGRVLLVGDRFDNATTAETYDPQANVWSAAPAMEEPRSGFATALLPDGRVLVCGGGHGTAPDALASAEIFDPDAGTWTGAGAMTSPHWNHTATALADGRVLVAGGGGLFGGVASTEVYDWWTGRWSSGPSLLASRNEHVAVLLQNGRVLVATGMDSGEGAEILDPLDPVARTRRPVVDSVSAFTYDGPLVLTGHFRGDSEAGSGHAQGAAGTAPVVEVRSLASGRRVTLAAVPHPPVPAPAGWTPNLWDDPLTLSADEIPAIERGWHMVSVSVGAIRSNARFLSVGCGVALTSHPTDQTVSPGGRATFRATANGARSWQWRRDGVAIPGATSSSYTTLPVTASDSGSRYGVEVTGACPTSKETSNEAVLTVADTSPPTASVVSPSGGEFWLISEDGKPASTHQVTWAMSDDVRICRVRVSLRYSTDGGGSYVEAPAGGGLPAVFGVGGSCSYADAVTQTNATYTVPTTFPSGVVGSLYEVRVEVSDQTGLPGHTTVVDSPNPFYIVQASPDSVRTLILAHTSRMQALGVADATQKADLDQKLEELAASPRVQGLVVDLGGATGLSALYALWDADPGHADKANAVLFGCHDPVPAWCDGERDGVHDLLRQRLAAYTGVRYLVVVGDDRIVPMARVADGGVLFTEREYVCPGGDCSAPVDLRASGSTVGRALEATRFLTDDPLASADEVRPADLSAYLFTPDLATGRLVETPAEIASTVATFLSQDGVLDLSALDPDAGHQALVEGYDFLIDGAIRARRRWKEALGADPVDHGSLAPVDGSLVGQTWGLGSSTERAAALRAHLSGNGGARYGVMSLSGHANHHGEGVPGTDPFDIQGLEAREIHGPDACVPGAPSGLELAGAVAYSIGCHGGLSVPGTCSTDPDHSLDLPQTYLSRGVVTYVANSGFGWGLKHGIGYAERLAEIFTEEMTAGGTVVVGDAVVQAKRRYVLETPRQDPYDEKTLMQWTVFGLPMYAVKTGIGEGGTATVEGRPGATSKRPFGGRAPALEERPPEERFGPVVVRRGDGARGSLPPYLTRLDLSFDLTAAGVHVKRDSLGRDAAENPALLDPGCPDADGCYYTLNGLVERSTGSSDLPVQPYLVYDSRLSGTSQHGVLWKGGEYAEESGWVPVFAELQSNGGDGGDHGTLPRGVKMGTIGPRVVPGEDPPGCRPSDRELNSLLVTTGEAVAGQTAPPFTYTGERVSRTVDLEVFYFNDQATPSNNCDREGPALGTPPFHAVDGRQVAFAVTPSDASGIWRVLVVHTTNALDESGHGAWVPLELADDAGTWRGTVTVPPSTRLSYVVQAVDRRGNVTWDRYVTTDPPVSGVDHGVANVLDVEVGAVPTVTGFLPGAGPVGSLVTVAGTGFAGATAVTFGGVGSTAFAVDSPTQVTAAVPAGAVSGPVAVTTAAGTGASAASFTVLPTLSIGDVSGAEGDAGTTPAVFTVTLSQASPQAVTVEYATADGSALAGSDFVSTQGALVFGAGQTSTTVSVTTLGDTTYEPDETFLVSLSNVVGAVLGDALGRGTISNDDALPVVSVADAAFVEGDAGTTDAAFVVTLSRASSQAVTVDYATADGTAMAGGDYTSRQGSVVFDPGQTSQTVSVSVFGDTTYEPDETFLLNLSNTIGAGLGDPQGQGTISNDDALPMVSVADATVAEGDSGTTDATFVVTLSRPSWQAVTVDYATADGTAAAGSDYMSRQGSVVFDPGQTTGTVTVPVIGDTTHEPDETFVVNLSDVVGAGLADSQGQGTISNDDALPLVSVADAAVGEGDSGTVAAAFVVTLSGTSSQAVTVEYATADGTASSGSDYVSGQGSVVFDPGQTSQTVNVSVLGDTAYEPDETFLLDLSNVIGAGLADAQGLGTITNDDSGFVLSVADATVAEGDAGTADAVFEVTLLVASPQEVRVGYGVADGTATGGRDYVPVTGTLVLAPGTTAGTVRVPVRGDFLVEGDETFQVTLASPVNARIGDGQGLGTIEDDDDARDVGTDLDGDGKWDLLWRNSATGATPSG